VLHAQTPAADAWAGDVSIGLQLSESEAKSRRYTVSADLQKHRDDHEYLREADADREYVRTAGGKTELDRDKYDLRLTYRHDIGESGLFGYVSPRLRRNASAFYQRAHALRAGLGGRFQPAQDFKLVLGTGVGYGVASVAEGPRIREELAGAGVQARWQINPMVEARLELTHEQSRRERYRNVEASLRTKLSSHLGVQVRASHERGYPLSSTDPSAERNLDVSLSYSL